MGNRTNFGFRTQLDGPIIFFYQHSAPSNGSAQLANAIKLLGEHPHCDPSYSTRRVITHIVGMDYDRATGYGIDTIVGDNENPIPVVDWEAEEVIIYPNEFALEFNERDKCEVYSLKEFVNTFAGDEE